MKPLRDRTRLVIALASALAISGCGGPARLDTSSEEGLKASKKAMTSGMTDKQKEAFAQDLWAAVMVDEIEKVFKGQKSSMFHVDEPSEASELDMFKPLHGMTAAQIHTRADEARRAIQAHERR